MNLRKLAGLLCTTALLCVPSLNAQDYPQPDAHAYHLKVLPGAYHMRVEKGLPKAPLAVFLGTPMSTVPLPGNVLWDLRPTVLLQLQHFDDQGALDLDFSWSGPASKPFVFHLQLLSVEPRTGRFFSSPLIRGEFDGSAGADFTRGC